MSLCPLIILLSFISVRKNTFCIPSVVSKAIIMMKMIMITVFIEASVVINIPETICISKFVSISDVTIVADLFMSSHNTIFSISIWFPRLWKQTHHGWR